MADGRKISQQGTDNTLNEDHLFTYYDPNEVALADQNKKGSVGNYFYPMIGREVERTSAATLSITKGKTVFTGSSAATWTLPAGASTIVGKEYRFDSIGSGTVTINRAGADTINGASTTSFTLKPYQRGVVAYWDGTNWIIG